MMGLTNSMKNDKLFIYILMLEEMSDNKYFYISYSTLYCTHIEIFSFFSCCKLYNWTYFPWLVWKSSNNRMCAIYLFKPPPQSNPCTRFLFYKELEIVTRLISEKMQHTVKQQFIFLCNEIRRKEANEQCMRKMTGRVFIFDIRLCTIT